MLPTTLRLEAVRCTAFDAHLARLGGGRLTRAGSRTYLESDVGIASAGHELFLAGIRVAPCGGPPTPGPSLRRSIAFDLVPLDEALEAIDVVEIRRIPLGEASAELMRRRAPWLRGSPAKQSACRRLLRDEDAVLGWRRVLWCSMPSLRAARRLVRLRPVVFDSAGIERTAMKWIYASEGAIERWAFA
jgi:hypothetical protein